LQGFRMDHLHQRFHGHKLLLHVALVLQMAPDVLTPGFWTGKMGGAFLNLDSENVFLSFVFPTVEGL
jgi:hypothetical protein